MDKNVENQTTFSPAQVKLLWFVRDVVRREGCRLVVRSGIDAHERKIAVMPGPFEIVRVTSVKTDVLGRRVNDANVAIRFIGEEVVREPFI